MNAHSAYPTETTRDWLTMPAAEKEGAFRTSDVRFAVPFSAATVDVFDRLRGECDGCHVPVPELRVLSLEAHGSLLRRSSGGLTLPSMTGDLSLVTLPCSLLPGTEVEHGVLDWRGHEFRWCAGARGRSLTSARYGLRLPFRTAVLVARTEAEMARALVRLGDVFPAHLLLTLNYCLDPDNAKGAWIWSRFPAGLGSEALGAALAHPNRFIRKAALRVHGYPAGDGDETLAPLAEMARSR